MKNEKNSIIFTAELRSRTSGLHNGNKAQVGMKPGQSKCILLEKEEKILFSQKTSSAAIWVPDVYRAGVDTRKVEAGSFSILPLPGGVILLAKGGSRLKRWEKSPNGPFTSPSDPECFI